MNTDESIERFGVVSCQHMRSLLNPRVPSSVVDFVRTIYIHLFLIALPVLNRMKKALDCYFCVLLLVLIFNKILSWITLQYSSKVFMIEFQSQNINQYTVLPPISPVSPPYPPLSPSVSMTNIFLSHSLYVFLFFPLRTFQLLMYLKSIIMRKAVLLLQEAYWI